MYKSSRNAFPAIAALLLLAVSTSAVAKPTAVEVVNAPDVVVANTEPLAVEVINEPVFKEPYYAKVSNNGEGQVSFAAVPAGKRLYIEYYSMRVLTDPGSFAWCFLQVYETVGQTTYERAHHEIVLHRSEPVPAGSELFIASTPMVLTADEYQVPIVSCTWTAGQSPFPSFAAYITGYTVDLP